VAICFITIVFDGYDLIVYGAVVPSLLQYEPWGLTPPQAGAIGSYALIGMLIGALVVGTITDIVGRSKIMLVCITWFSLAMALCAVAPNPQLFGLFRFIAGLGLGGVVPTAIALTIEYSPAYRRNLNNALMFSGYSVGGILSLRTGRRSGFRLELLRLRHARTGRGYGCPANSWFAGLQACADKPGGPPRGTHRALTQSQVGHPRRSTSP
jgi:MFS family permease